MADLYSDLTADENLYGKKKIVLPNPRFVIFYNGAEKRPEKEILRLSDLFAIKETEIELELTAVMLNINPGYNAGLLDTCKSLGDYSEYTYRVRKYAKEMELEEAVERAITECIRENILADFLQKYRAEAKKVSIYEYDEEKHMRQTRAEGYEEGWEEGRKEGRKEGIEAGREEGIAIVIELYKELGRTQECTVKQIVERYAVSEGAALEYMKKYW